MSFALRSRAAPSPPSILVARTLTLCDTSFDSLSAVSVSRAIASSIALSPKPCRRRDCPRRCRARRARACDLGSMRWKAPTSSTASRASSIGKVWPLRGMISIAWPKLPARILSASRMSASSNSHQASACSGARGPIAVRHSAASSTFCIKRVVASMFSSGG